MNLKTRLLTLAGILLLGIGAVGAVIPVLPTTPFVITASVCFAGNPRMREWLMRNRFFAEYINNYRQHTGLRRRTVILSLSTLWVTLSISMLAVARLWATLLLSGIGIAVTVHILWIANPRDKNINQQDAKCMEVSK